MAVIHKWSLFTRIYHEDVYVCVGDGDERVVIDDRLFVPSDENSVDGSSLPTLVHNPDAVACLPDHEVDLGNVAEQTSGFLKTTN